MSQENFPGYPVENSPSGPVNKFLFKIGNTSHFEYGGYKIEEEGNPNVTGSLYEYLDIVSTQLNQLKAKLYNLIEAQPLSEKQSEALKGLVKGFCNHAYNNTIKDMDGLFRRLGFKIEEYYPTVDALDNRDR